MQRNAYKNLLHPDHFPVEEPKKSYVTFTERHLQAVWFEQKYFRSLKTANGESVTVVSPGIWNAEAGPDFKKAHLCIGDREVKGDVEIHLSDEGWVQHKHHLNERYNEVIFHLSLWPPKEAKEIRTESGRKIVQAYLESNLTIPIMRIVKLIDLDLYPYQNYTGTGKCSEQLFRKLSEKEIRYFFQSAAEWRLEKKWERLTVDGQSLEEGILEGIAMTLGYKHNATAFVELLQLLKRRHDLSETELFSYALELCGYFSEPYVERWKDCAQYEKLRDCAHGNKASSFTLIHHQVRPYNHPIRRIIYLVKLLCDPTSRILCERLIRSWQAYWEDWFRDPKGVKKGLEFLEAIVPVYGDPFFNHHYLFSSKRSDPHLPLIGKSLIHKILVNVYFPFLYESIAHREDPRELNFFLAFFNRIPSEETGKIKYLYKRFFGNAQYKIESKSAMMEQGAYQLHRDFCLHYEASCEGCPFVKRYKEEYLPLG